VSDRAIAVIPFERVLLAVLIAAAVLAPLFISDLFLVGYLTPWLIWSAAALGLNLLMGLAGQIHLGYGAVMAVGAYASIHLARAGVPFMAAVAGGGLMSGLVGSVFGLPAMRVRGLFLAISGGAQATLVAPRPSVLGISIATDVGRYYGALLLAVATGLFSANVRRTDLGRTLVALREKDYAAAVIGVNVFYYKSLAFAVS